MSNVLFDYLKVGNVYYDNLTAAPGTSYASLTNAVLSVAGQTVDVTIAGPWTEAVLRITGQDVTFVNPLSVDLLPATLNITGQSVQLPYGQFFTNLLPATLTIAGQVLNLAIVIPQEPDTTVVSNRIILSTSANRINLATSA